MKLKELVKNILKLKKEDSEDQQIEVQERKNMMDGIEELMTFADKLEKATIQTIEDGVMTGDLVMISSLDNKKKVDSEEFLHEVNARLKAILN